MSSERDSKTQADVTRGTRDAATLAADLSMAGHALPAGTTLHDYVITGLLGEGGFGIVYLAEDSGLQREVAIKEYLPSSMASRAKNAMTVLVKSQNHQETFAMGLKSFVNEARLLARFDHPALVKVHRFWEEHGTAYMVMPYYSGPTLKAVLADLGRLPDEAELRRWLWPIMDALIVLHAAQCYHRDIAPDNILITEKGPLLLDFGAARRVIGDMTHALTVVLKPGFAPIEQYGDLPGMTQGPWTDIYALGSVLYAAISGRRPMPSVERLLDDRLRPLAEIAAGRFPATFLQAIDHALALKPADRPQSVQAFRELLERRDPAGPAAGAPVAPAGATADGAAARAYARTEVQPRPAKPTAPAEARVRRRLVPMTLGATAVLALAMGVYVFGGGQRGAPAETPAPEPKASVPAAGSGATSMPTPASAPALTSEPAAPAAPSAASAASAAAASPTPNKGPSGPAEGVTDSSPDSATTAKPAAAKAAPNKAPALVSRPAAEAAGPSAPAPKSPEIKAKCSDILQKASLETLTASEQAFLRKECR